MGQRDQRTDANHIGSDDGTGDPLWNSVHHDRCVRVLRQEANESEAQAATGAAESGTAVALVRPGQDIGSIKSWNGVRRKGIHV